MPRTSPHPRARILLALPIAAAALSLAACSSGAVQRPTTVELSTGITTILENVGQAGTYTSDQILCIAEKFYATELDDQDLANIAAGKDEQSSQSAKDLVTSTMSEAITTCVG